MIFNTTYSDKEADAIISDLVGDSFSFFEALKMRGTGSKRMIIDNVSPGFDPIMNKVSDINYGNIEIRKKGILVYITKGLKSFTWAIPFYQLHIYNTNSYSIHAQGNFVRFKKNKTFKENKEFLDKILDLKIENDKQYNFYESIS